MARGDKNPLAEVSSPVAEAPQSETHAETQPETQAADEAGEIDRIMQEIEDLEKKMDAGSDMSNETENNKVVALHQKSEGESLAETDAVPPADEPLMKADTLSEGNGGLSLKIGGCSEVSLEFSRAGISVTLTCNDENLCITTDQGAEFRIPFNRAA